MLALVVDFLEELIEIERIQPLVPLQGFRARLLMVFAAAAASAQEPAPQLLRAHRFVHHL